MNPARLVRIAVCALVWGVGPGFVISAHSAGEELFVKNCAPCHGKDGKAQTPIARKLGVKDLTASKLPDAEIKNQVLLGRKDKHGKVLMPPFREKLTDAEVESIVQVVKNLRK